MTALFMIGFLLGLFISLVIFVLIMTRKEKNTLDLSDDETKQK
jgi:hypothetical protein